MSSLQDSEKTLTLNGSSLSVAEIAAFLTRTKTTIVISGAALERVRKGHEFLCAELGKRIIYGINTGFGPMASHIIQQAELKNLQKNLVRSHAVGMGEPLPSSYVLAAMLVRLNTLIHGYSGVSPKLVERLVLFINHRITAVVPDHGAVGTSGDLVQLAHIALALIGEGDAMYEGETQPVRTILETLHIAPTYELQPKEGLALINGTSMMTGIGAVLLRDAEQLIAFAVSLGGFALELIGGFEDSINERLHELRPHPGQRDVAYALRSVVRGSKRMKDRSTFQKKLHIAPGVEEIPEDVQEIYSLRCIAQILGPVRDVISNTRSVLEIEMNAVTDNPIVDWEKQMFWHGGNFHGDYIASALDQLKIALVKLTMLSERRINFFMHAAVNRKFPAFLNLKTPGLTLGLQGLQFVATSTTARSQTLAFPQYIHSIPTNGDNQDVVSMGTDSALIAAHVVDHAFIVLTIELVALGQATDILRASAELSPFSHELYEALRKLFPAVIEDRSMTSELHVVRDHLRHKFPFHDLWRKN